MATMLECIVAVGSRESKVGIVKVSIVLIIIFFTHIVITILCNGKFFEG